MINNEGKGQLLTGLRTKIALWPLFDLYGKVEEIAIIDDETAERAAEMFGDSNTESLEQDHKSTTNDAIDAETASGYVASFHSTHGQYVCMDSRQTTAKRFDSFWNALTFTRLPLKPFDLTFLEVMKVEANYAGKQGWASFSYERPDLEKC